MQEDTTAIPHYHALIPAAGAGSRMNAPLPKQYLELAGKPVIQYVMDVFAASADIAHVYVVLSPDDTWMGEYVASGKIRFDKNRVSLLDCGGATRRESVMNALKVISQHVADPDWILVHDAARPGLTVELLDKLIAGIGQDPVGGILALPVADTVKRQTESNVRTVSREGLWLAQTPQMFRFSLLLQALEEHPDVTDEAGAIEAAGHVPRLVEGHLRNSKITRPDDMQLVELFLTELTAPE